MLDKPSFGAACNGCGLCCRTVVCALGSISLGLVKNYGDRAPGPCPSIVDNADGSIACGMVLRPRDFALGSGSAHDLRAAIKLLIGTGAGCDEADADTTSDDVRAMHVRYLERIGPDKIERAAALWFGVKK